MRAFSEYEKKVIGKIVKTDLRKSNVLNVISDVCFENRGVKIEEEQIVLFYFTKDKNATFEFFEVVSLLKYLEVNHLIFIHKNYENTSKGDYISKNLDQNTIIEKQSELTFEPIPTTVHEIIIEYSKSYLFVGTELKKLVDNNFKTSEQIQHEIEIAEARIQTNFSRWSFYIALVALLFSLLVPFIFKTKIDKEQYDTVLNEMKNNSKSVIHELKERNNESKIIFDSIKMRILTQDSINNFFEKEFKKQND